MKKKIYLTLLIVVTQVCIIFGTLVRAGGFGSKRYIAGKTEAETADRPAGWDRITEKAAAEKAAAEKAAAEKAAAEKRSAEKAAAEGMAGEGMTAEGMTEERAFADRAVPEKAAAGESMIVLDADLDYGSLTILTGESLSTDYQGDAELKPDVSLEDGVLMIRQTGQWLDFNLRTLLNPRAELTVTLPEGTVLENAVIELDLGDVSVSGLPIRSGSIVNNLGKIVFADCRIGTMDIEADMGDVELEDCAFLDLSVEEDLGKVRIGSALNLDNASMDLATDLGKVVLNGKEQGGSYLASGTGEYSLRVHNDLGDIEVNY